MTPYDHAPEGPLQRALNRLDRLGWTMGGIFLWLSNLCLLAMLGLTTATIILRPLSMAPYWMWPWTMVFFIWLSFFGFFALYARLKDVRVDFLALRLGPRGMAATRPSWTRSTSGSARLWLTRRLHCSLTRRSGAPRARRTQLP